MKNLPNRGYFFLALLIGAGVIFYHALFRIPSGEGFNPSDDGVVLAQSWRILLGEIPHRDFISLRPAGSGFMHTIDYLLPGPLELSSRWFVLIEYIIYSLLCIIFLMGSLFKTAGREKKIFLFVLAGVFSCVLNINHYNLFAWTTIDALFWIGMALFAFGMFRDATGWSRPCWIFLAVSGAVVSALCRQTFALPALVLLALAVRHLWLLRSFYAWIGAAAGLLPALAYFAFLVFTSSFDDFLTQMAGRTELWQTGFLRYAQSFWESPVVLLFVPALVIAIIENGYQEAGRKNDKIYIIKNTQKYITILAVFGVSFLVFLWPARLFDLTFNLFWLLVLSIFLNMGRSGLGWKKLEGPVWILLVAWTSSVSLGDNAPVFTAGLLGSSSILLIATDLKFPEKGGIRMSGIACAIVCILLISFSVRAQKQNNYRDLPAGQLQSEGGEVFSDLKGIKLNQNVLSYLQEVRRVYEALGSPKGQFAVWPNNPMVYRMLGSPNPFPLDWMQGAEFKGCEERLAREVDEELRHRKLFILVEKYNSKWIAREKVMLDWTSPDYGYLKLLENSATEMPDTCEWFRIFATN